MIDLEQAKAHPEEHFSSPADVKNHNDLTTEQQIDILEAWRQEIQQHIVAEEENMAGNEENYHHEEDLLAKIHELLVELKEQ